MKALLILLVCISLFRPENHMEIWHTWADTQTAFMEEVEG